MVWFKREKKEEPKILRKEFKCHCGGDIFINAFKIDHEQRVYLNRNTSNRLNPYQNIVLCIKCQAMFDVYGDLIQEEKPKEVQG